MYVKPEINVYIVEMNEIKVIDIVMYGENRELKNNFSFI